MEDLTHNMKFIDFVNRYWLTIPVEQRPDTKDSPDPIFSAAQAICRIISDQMTSVGRKRRIKKKKPVDPDAREGEGWRLSHVRVFYNQTMHDWLEGGLESLGPEAARIQRAWKFVSTRRKIRPVMKVFHQLRKAFSHAMQAQLLVDDAEDDDDLELRQLANIAGANEINAVQTIMRTLHMLVKDQGGPKQCIWAAERILANASKQKANLLAIIQCKHTLKQVLHLESSPQLAGTPGQVITARGDMHTAKERLELLSYALQEARRLDHQVMGNILASDMYAFDPLEDLDGNRLSMESTTEFQHALKAYQTLRVVSESLPHKVKRIHLTDQILQETLGYIKEVDELQIGEIQEIETARSKVVEIQSLCSALEEAIKRSDATALPGLIKKAREAQVRRPVVERARVCELELRLIAQLKEGIESKDIQQLAKAIQYSMDKQLEEAVRRKKRKQRQMRAKWILKKKKSGLTKEEELELATTEPPTDQLEVDVQKQMDQAQKTLHEWLEEAKSAEKSADGNSAQDKETAAILSDLANTEANALSMALEEASGVFEKLKQMQAEKSAGSKSDKRRDAREKMQFTLRKATELLHQHSEHQDQRMRSEDLVTRPDSNSHLLASAIGGHDLLHTKTSLIKAIQIGREAGLTRDLEDIKMDKMKTQDLDKFDEDDLEDYRLVSELKNALKDIKAVLMERKEALEQVEEVCKEIVHCTDDGKTDDDLDALHDQLKSVLHQSRLLCLDEDRLAPLQDAYEASANKNVSQLLEAIEGAKNILESAAAKRKRAESRKRSMSRGNRRSRGKRVSNADGNKPRPRAVSSANNNNNSQNHARARRPASRSTQRTQPQPQPAAEASKPKATRTKPSPVITALSNTGTPMETQTPSEHDGTIAETPQGETPRETPQETPQENPEIDMPSLSEIAVKSVITPKADTPGGPAASSEEDGRKTVGDMQVHSGTVVSADLPKDQSAPAATTAPAPEKPKATNVPPSVPNGRTTSKPSSADAARRGQMSKPEARSEGKKPSPRALSSTRRNQARTASNSRSSSRGMGRRKSSRQSLSKSHTAPRPQQTPPRPSSMHRTRSQDRIPRSRNVKSPPRVASRLARTKSDAALQHTGTSAPRTRRRGVTVGDGRSSNSRPSTNSASRVRSPSAAKSPGRQARRPAGKRSPTKPTGRRIGRRSPDHSPSRRRSTKRRKSPPHPRRSKKAQSELDASRQDAADMMFKLAFEDDKYHKILEEHSIPLDPSVSDFMSESKVSSISSVVPGDPKQTARQAMKLAHAHANHILKALDANLEAVTRCVDLISRPEADTPMKKGRVRDSDLIKVFDRIKQALKQADEAQCYANLDMFGQNELTRLQKSGQVTNDDIRDSRLHEACVRQMMRIEIHLEERDKVRSDIDKIMAIAADYPFVASDLPDDNKWAEVGISDRDLNQMSTRMKSYLRNGRLIGVVEAELTDLQDVYEDLETFIEARSEARQQLSHTLMRFNTLKTKHPKLKEAVRTLDEVTEYEEKYVYDENAKQGTRALLTSSDLEFKKAFEAVQATLEDCEMVSLPTKDTKTAQLRSALRVLEAYILARAQLRGLIDVCLKQDNEKLSRQQVRTLVMLAKKCGFSTSNVGLRSKRDRSPTKKKLSELTERMNQIEKARANRDSLPRGSKLPKESDLERLDKKLNLMVPEARKKLDKAIRDKDAEALDQAIAYARDLEAQLKKLKARQGKVYHAIFKL